MYSIKPRLSEQKQPLNPPFGNTGGTLRHPCGIKEKFTKKVPQSAEKVPQSAEILANVKKRKTRAKETSESYSDFLDLWFFDWITLTQPNKIDGKGTKAGNDSDIEVRKAQAKMCEWALARGLHPQRIGKGSDGYQGAVHFGNDPTSHERVASVRAGHKTNMPGIELPGADGACATLAVQALNDLGPMLMPRCDVSLDVSQEGLYDDLLQYARARSRSSKMSAPRIIESESGKTFMWGKGEASVKVYQKDLERVFDGKLDAADADPNLLRIEFTFRPVKGKKSGMAKVAKEKGPGALLGTVNWVRAMTEKIGHLTDNARGQIAVTRVDQTPDPRTAYERAEHGAQQYARTFCEAAAAEIVAKDFDGDWLAATICKERIEDAAIDLFARFMKYNNAAINVCAARGLDATRDKEEEARRASFELEIFIDKQNAETETAQQEFRIVLNEIEEKRAEKTAEKTAEKAADDAVKFADVPF